MTLTEEQKNHVMNWLNEKANAKLPCPICGEFGIGPGDIIVGVKPYSTTGAELSTKPMVQVICSTCGFVRLFSAVVMDLPV